MSYRLDLINYGLRGTILVRSVAGEAHFMRLAILLFCSVFALGQEPTIISEPKTESPAGSRDQKTQNNDFGLGKGAHGRQLGNLEVLSDTQGVDFGPYFQRILQEVREHWYRAIPESAEMKRGKLQIEFAITRDGKVADMRLTASSGDVALDRAAWAGISGSNPFKELPSEFTGPYLALRFRFYYNPTKSDLVGSPPKPNVQVIISPPGELQVPIGGMKMVTASVIGGKKNGVKWTVAGAGCSGSACGRMEKGFYRAPDVLPSPPVVTLTAISKADPNAKAWVDVNIVQPSPSQ